MYILHVITSMDPKYGGPAQGIRNLDVGGRGTGIIREVVCLDASDSSYLGKDNFKVHALGAGNGVWNYSKYLMPWLINNIERFDVVIINGLWQYHSYAAWRVLKKIKKNSKNKKSPKILVMPHGMLDPYFQRAKERRFKAVRNFFYWKLIENKIVNDADGLLFTCKTELLLARETFKPYHPRKEYDVGYGIEAPPMFHHYMSVEFNEISPELKGAPYILFLSRIHPKKGIGLLVDAYIALYKSINPKDETFPKLVIAGPSLDSSYGKLLQNKVKKEPDIKNNIFFPGMLTRDSKWGAFYGCEAFVLPSHQENFGIVVAEALACGKPVLISNQVNIWREIVEEGAGKVENDNKSGVQKLLKSWIDLSKKDKIQMGTNATNAYKKYFAVNKIAQNYMDAFTDNI